MKLRVSSALRSRLFGVPLALAAVALCVVTAGAYFATSGSGAASGSVGTLQTVTVAAFAGGDGAHLLLLPGGTAADVILRVQNPNGFTVTLVSVAGNGTITAPGYPGCTTTGVTFSNQSALSVAVPAGSSLIDLPGAASMSSASSNGCQGAVFSIPVAITVHK